MIIHPSTVDLNPIDLRLLLDSGLTLNLAPSGDRLVPIGRDDLATRLRAARARTEDPARRSVIVSFLKQLRV
jgi:hypothetical protein